ncbi:hypothetical protein K1719_030709 [Acacia pycnantha]|nr:hypothetical protein K1719_030709 [Acacia pycnantha]
MVSKAALYVMAVAVMSLAYGVVQLPFAASYALKNKRLMPLHFEFYADKVMCFFLATGSGAGIAVCREVNKENDGGGDYNYDDVTKQYSKFWDKLLAASVLLFLAWLCLAVVSIIFYNNDDNTNPTLSTHHDNNNQSNTPKPSPKEPAQHTHVPTDEHVKPSTDDVSV